MTPTPGSAQGLRATIADDGPLATAFTVFDGLYHAFTQDPSA